MQLGGGRHHHKHQASLSLVATLCLALGLVVSAPVAKARHNFSILDVSAAEVSPGDSVSVRGFSYTDTAFIYLGALDGPVLAELQPSDQDIISGDVVIPSNAPPGRTLLYAVQQDSNGAPTRLPGRAALTIKGAGVSQNQEGPLAVEARPNRFAVRGDGSLATTVMVALATAVFLGGVTTAYLRSSRRRASAQVAR